MQDIIIPQLGESVTEAVIAQWQFKEGDYVNKDDVIAELETDKVSVEITASHSGVLKDIKFKQNDTAKIGDLLCKIDIATKENAASKENVSAHSANAASPQNSAENTQHLINIASPAARKILNDHNIVDVPASSSSRKITKADAQKLITTSPTSNDINTSDDVNASQNMKINDDIIQLDALKSEAISVTSLSAIKTTRTETRQKISKLRQTIAARLKESQNTAAILTTFNEIDMTAVTAIRNANKDAFLKEHEAKLGYMSFFVKATVQALKEYPIINSYIQEDEVISPDYNDIGIAVGSDKGLFVPILRNAEKMSFAEIEKEIIRFGQLARSNGLKVSDMTGGTFTITNGGIYGSMLSTPIINPPQSAILGMHNIVERPVVSNGAIVIAPVMYIALSYDHRLIDGKDAVLFLSSIKKSLEKPDSLLLHS